MTECSLEEWIPTIAWLTWHKRLWHALTMSSHQLTHPCQHHLKSHKTQAGLPNMENDDAGWPMPDSCATQKWRQNCWHQSHKTQTRKRPTSGKCGHDTLNQKTHKTNIGKTEVREKVQKNTMTTKTQSQGSETPPNRWTNKQMMITKLIPNKNMNSR